MHNTTIWVITVNSSLRSRPRQQEWRSGSKDNNSGLHICMRVWVVKAVQSKRSSVPFILHLFCQLTNYTASTTFINFTIPAQRIAWKRPSRPSKRIMNALRRTEEYKQDWLIVVISYVLTVQQTIVVVMEIQIHTYTHTYTIHDRMYVWRKKAYNFTFVTQIR